MDVNFLIDYLLYPLLIGFARIFDVSIGTLRIILISKGQKKYAPILGFFEVLIWITIIGQIISKTNNIACYLGYSLGFAAGNYIGMILEEKLALGYVIVRIITPYESFNLIENLKNEGFGVTYVPAFGTRGKVEIIYTTINREHIKKVESIINRFDPNIFYTIEELKYVSKGKGIFPVK
ncbi:MAG: DUF5698 domain-containing protein [Bacteroidales bacterium]|nr:DUF5698 domain-containing protein [Bacteroidales bacterium]